MVLCPVCDCGLCRVGEGWGLMIDGGTDGQALWVIRTQDPRLYCRPRIRLLLFMR